VDTLETLRQMIIEKFEIDPEKVQADTDLTSLGIDSLSIAEFIFDVEDKFKVELPDPRVEIRDLKVVKPPVPFTTLRELSAQLDQLIETQRPKAPGAPGA
jgi:acyl carrier protein